MQASAAAHATPVRAPARSSARRALWLLKREHRWLLDRLAAAETAGDDDPALAERVRAVCGELAAHAALEHRLFYPALDAVLSDTEAVRTARVEHELLDTLLARLLCADAGDPFFRPRLRVLSALLRRHIATEEAWFAEAREAAADWPRLVAALQAKQHERRRLPPASAAAVDRLE